MSTRHRPNEMFFILIIVYHIDSPNVGIETGFELQAESVSFIFLILFLTNFESEIELSCRYSTSSGFKDIIFLTTLILIVDFQT